jgi:carboxyl-terminal processing protease
MYLRKNVDRFKMRQEQKLVSLNLETRRAQKESDEAFRKEMNAEKERLAQQDFPYKEFRLGPPPPPRIKAPESDSEDGEEEESELSTDNDDYEKVDVHLRESLRVVQDAVNLGENRQYWASNHPPLTAVVINRKG